MGNRQPGGFPRRRGQAPRRPRRWASTGLTVIKARRSWCSWARPRRSYRTMRGPIPRAASSAPRLRRRRRPPPPPPDESAAWRVTPARRCSREGPRPVKLTAHSARRANAVAAAALAEKCAPSQLREERDDPRRPTRAACGQSARALTLLDAARTRLPMGSWSRSVRRSTIEALVRSGQRALAAKRAEPSCAITRRAPWRGPSEASSSSLEARVVARARACSCDVGGVRSAERLVGGFSVSRCPGPICDRPVDGRFLGWSTQSLPRKVFGNRRPLPGATIAFGAPAAPRATTPWPSSGFRYTGRGPDTNPGPMSPPRSPRAAS